MGLSKEYWFKPAWYSSCKIKGVYTNSGIATFICVNTNLSIKSKFEIQTLKAKITHGNSTLKYH